MVSVDEIGWDWLNCHWRPVLNPRSVRYVLHVHIEHESEVARAPDNYVDESVGVAVWHGMEDHILARIHLKLAHVEHLVHALLRLKHDERLVNTRFLKEYGGRLVARILIGKHSMHCVGMRRAKQSSNCTMVDADLAIKRDRSVVEVCACGRWWESREKNALERVTGAVDAGPLWDAIHGRGRTWKASELVIILWRFEIGVDRDFRGAHIVKIESKRPDPPSTIILVY